jgi:CheY-like chemotaxis protein
LAKRRVLLVDDEVSILLTMKAVLEISGFEVDTAASAREARSKLKLREYQMVITDMRMENDAAGRDVIQAARTAPYHPAVALLTSFPDDDWADIGADRMLVKPMQTGILLRQIEMMLDAHSAKLQRLADSAAAPAKSEEASAPAKATKTEHRTRQRSRLPSGWPARSSPPRAPSHAKKSPRKNASAKPKVAFCEVVIAWMRPGRWCMQHPSTTGEAHHSCVRVSTPAAAFDLPGSCFASRRGVVLQGRRRQTPSILQRPLHRTTAHRFMLQ